MAKTKKTAKQTNRKSTGKTAKKTAKKSAKKTAKKKPVTSTSGHTVKKKAAKKAAKKTARTKAPAAKKTAAKKPVVKSKMNARDKKYFQNLLLTLRERITGDIHFLSGDNLRMSARDSAGDLSSYSIHMADQGTDNFDREFALNLMSSEQDVLYEIDEALRRIDEGTYGLCEMTGEPIEKERLKVLPYARLSVRAQSEIEKGRSKFRPFGTMIHAPDMGSMPDTSESDD